MKAARPKALTVSEAPRLEQWPTGLEALAPGWREPVERFLASDDGRQLSAFLQRRLQEGAIVYPPNPLRALQLTPSESVRVVILGQDPYHGPGQAYGLAFAVGPQVRTPPSLRNIRVELTREYGCEPVADGLLEHWARQGVLLLNASLTVEAGLPASHARIGWQALTQSLFGQVRASAQPVVFMLWGAHAQSQLPPEDQRAPHLWCLANHPSPLSALRPPVPFIGCGHFRRANDFLRTHGLAGIDWLGDTVASPWERLAGDRQTMA